MGMEVTRLWILHTFTITLNAASVEAQSIVAVIALPLVGLRILLILNGLR